jgi:hypothetical protein
MTMSKERQAEFVAELIDNIRDTLLARIDRVPENWDGHELRLWVSENFKELAVMGFAMKGTRLTEYRNDRLVLNL